MLPKHSTRRIPARLQKTPLNHHSTAENNKPNPHRFQPEATSRSYHSLGGRPIHSFHTGSHSILLEELLDTQIAGRHWGSKKETLVATGHVPIGRSIADYASHIWSPKISETGSGKVQIFQTQALRTGTGCHLMSIIAHTLHPYRNQDATGQASPHHAWQTVFSHQ